MSYVTTYSLEAASIASQRTGLENQVVETKSLKLQVDTVPSLTVCTI